MYLLNLGKINSLTKETVRVKKERIKKFNYFDLFATSLGTGTLKYRT